MENKELENKQLNDEQMKEVAGGNFISDIVDTIYDSATSTGKKIMDELKPFVEPVIDKLIPEPPKPNPYMDPNAFKVPDQYDPMK